jgi:uncharacterized ferritin-like protein (DUF455 family)
MMGLRPAEPGSAPYPAGTVERWAWEYVSSTDLDHKRAPPPPPRDFAPAPSPLRLLSPGRPRELHVALRARKSPGPEAMRAPDRRAELLHTFLHHELQAAELMCWAILAFPDTPEAFRLGLLGVARDEIRHMGLYEEQLAALGHAYGAFPVRDWFWERIPAAPTPVGFVAGFGMGLEGANLDHTARFAERFRAIGDDAGAALQERIGAEEVPHVRFALHWFERWRGRARFDGWAVELPPPLSPLLMRGAPLNRAGRLEAGFSPAFIDELERWSPPAPAPGS